MVELPVQIFGEVIRVQAGHPEPGERGPIAEDRDPEAHLGENRADGQGRHRKRQTALQRSAVEAPGFGVAGPHWGGQISIIESSFIGESQLLDR